MNLRISHIRPANTSLRRIRFSKGQLVAFVLVFGALGGYILLSSQAATTADYFVAPNGSDSNPGTRSEPFATFDKCYRTKSPVVCEVAGGTYPAQVIKFDLTKTSPALGATFRPAQGQTVTVNGSVTLSGTTDFTWQGPITVNGSIGVSTCNITSNCTTGTIRYAKDVTFDGQSWDACHVVGQPSGGGSLNADGSINVTFRYCFSDKRDVTPGPAGLSTSPSVKDGQIPTNITYDHVHWYGGSNPSHYADCLHPFDMNGLTVTNNEFEWCEDYPILFNRTNGAVDATRENPSLIQNNICLASFAGNNSFSLGNPNTENMWNVTVSFNTCGLSLNNSTPMVNVKYQGNIRPVTSGANCNSSSGLTADHNLNRDTKGGATPAYGTDCSGRDTYINVPASSIYKGGIPADLHLVAASPARNIVPATLCPTTDFDGQSRNASDGFCDAGADEYIEPVSIWVSTIGDDTTCVRGDPTKPCQTFNRAYQLAKPGDTVSVAAGDYDKQSIYGDATKNIVDGTCSLTPAGQNLSACITFLPSGGKVTVRGLLVMASGLRLVGMDVINAGVGVAWKDNPSGVPCKKVAQPHDVIFDGIKNYVTGGVPPPGASPGGNASASGVYNVAFINSDFGPFYDSVGTAQFSNLKPESSSYCAAYPVEQLKDKNIYLYNNVWHDLYQTVKSNGPNCGSDPAQYFCNHMECIHWRASNSWIVSNKFLNCAQYDISVQTFGSNVPNIDNLRIIGNVFDRPCSNQTTPCGSISALRLTCNSGSDTVTNAVVAYNSIWGAPSFSSNCDSPTPFAGSVAVGNLNRYTNSQFTCDVMKKYSVTFAYNIWQGGSTAVCDPTGRILKSAVFPWTNPAYPDYNFSLVDGSEAADFVPVSLVVSGKTILCPSFDIAGSPRPAGGSTACAAGAYETSQTSVELPSGVGSGGQRPPTQTPTNPLPAHAYSKNDLNHDNRVNIYDLSILLSHFGTTASGAQGDLSGDGRIDVIDLSMLLSNYGR